MTDPLNPSRRRFLTAHVGGVALTGLTGCADGAGPEAADGNGSETADGSDGESADETGSDLRSDPPEPAALDLREANVVGVAFEVGGDGYAFDVTLHHDDDGESGYANWWQVERLDGARLGRRDLLHAHSEQPFTRSETVAVPDDATCVVVRGHDRTHGYGGVAAVVDLDAETVRWTDQGADPRSFDDVARCGR